MKELKLVKRVQVSQESLWTLVSHHGVLYVTGADTYLYMLHNDTITSFPLHHQRTVRCLCVHPFHRWLTTASFDSTIGIYPIPNTTSQELPLLAQLEGHENEIKHVAWSPDGQLLATCSRDKSIWLWFCEEDEEEPTFECLAVLSGHSQDIKAVAWHPVKRLLFSCGSDETVRCWSSSERISEWGDSLNMENEWSCMAVVKPSCANILWCLNVENTFLWVGSGDGQLTRIFIEIVGQNVELKEEKVIMLHQNRPIYALRMNENENYQSVGGDRCVCLWDNEFQLISRVTEAHGFNEIYSIVQQGPHYVTCAEDGSLCYWSIDNS